MSTRIGSQSFPGLWAKWSKREDDMTYYFDKSAVDGCLIQSTIGPLIEELKRRGFKVETFKMSIERDPESKVKYWMTHEEWRARFGPGSDAGSGDEQGTSESEVADG